MIYNEIIKNNDNVDILDSYAELNKEKLAEAYNKIYINMSSLISKYDDKVKLLAQGLTEDMVPVDISEKEYKNLNPESKIFFIQNYIIHTLKRLLMKKILEFSKLT